MACAFSRRSNVLVCVASLAIGVVMARPAMAASLSSRDVQIIGKAVGFLDPAPSGGIVAVAYSATDPRSKADARAIVGVFGGGIPYGSGMVTAKAVDVESLGDGTGFVAVIVAAGTLGTSAMDAAKARHILCITGDRTLVQSGGCVMAVQSSPRVDITVSHAAATAAGIGFASSFSMLVHEI